MQKKVEHKSLSYILNLKQNIDAQLYTYVKNHHRHTNNFVLKCSILLNEFCSM
jgi:hypothetical protein